MFNLNAKKIVIGGIAAGIVIFVISMGTSILTQQALSYDVLKLGGMRTIDDPIMALFFVHPWVLGFAMAIAFEKTKTGLGKPGMGRGKNFGLITWLLAGLPSAFLVWSSMNYPPGFTLNSVVGTLTYMVAAGIVIEKIMG